MLTRKVIFLALLTALALPIYSTNIGCGGGSAALDPNFNLTPDGDFDQDGVLNKDDADDDNDGILDADDAFPFDSAENGDLDGDGIGNNADDDADGDGVTKADDCNDLNASIFPNNADTPDEALIDADCDGLDGDIEAATWVSSTEGDDTNPGTSAAPVKTIGQAVTLASAKTAGQRDIYVVAGTYAEDVLVTDGVNIYGGYSILDNGARTRDLTQFKATLPGKNSDKTFTLKLSADPVNYTLLVEASSGSTIDGLNITSDPIGPAVATHNSNATIKNCEISETTPTASQKMNLGMIIVADSAAYTEYTVNITGNKIYMKGSGGSTDEKDFGIIGMPDIDSEAALTLNVTGNEINAEGTAYTAAAIYAADTDYNPLDPYKGDGMGDINLFARYNKITMNGTYDASSAIAGGMFGGASLLSLDHVYINNFEASGNVISMAGGDLSFPIMAGLVRDSSTVSNNVISVSAASGAAGITTVMAPTNIYHNTVYVDTDGVAIGLYSLAWADKKPNYINKTPGDVVNNIFDIRSNGGICYNVSVYEGVQTVTDNLAVLASPARVLNNDFFIDTVCPKSEIYYDFIDTTPIVNIVTSIDDLNNKVGFDANDPTEFGENIASDPLFVDVAGGDFQLQDGSPCIDTGNNEIVPADFPDVLGLWRPIGQGFDIGAYER